jgi:transposase
LAKSSPQDVRKIEALRRQGTLNRRPQTVTDPIFLANDFFDARDLVQVKYEMLRRASVDHAAVSQVAAAFGLSRPSFYQAQAVFEQRGVFGLVPQKRGPREAHKLTSEVMDFLVETRATQPKLRFEELAREVERRFSIRIHPRSIERALARQQKKRRRRPGRVS